MNEIEKLKNENERYKEINDGLLEVQHSLREEIKELRQWFQYASQRQLNLDKLKKEINDLKDMFESEKAYYWEQKEKADSDHMNHYFYGKYDVYERLSEILDYKED